MIYLYLFGTCFHFIYVFMIIVNKDFIHSGTLEYQKEQTNVLKELGFDIGNLL